jgi:hypothetical protein
VERMVAASANATTAGACACARPSHAIAGADGDTTARLVRPRRWRRRWTAAQRRGLASWSLLCSGQPLSLAGLCVVRARLAVAGGTV